ncbi:MAG: Vitamin B12 dependent methionine synthase activation subunit [Clostridia bacterium]|nr:Vitamin B12 dependent methionine synthase activation subunit [Clostridia bacterium]
MIAKIEPLPINLREVLRYAGGRDCEPAVEAMLQECIEEALGEFSYRVCYCRLPLQIDGKDCRLGGLTLHSKALAKTLSGCNEAILFGATLGVGIDRLIGKYLRISPAKALMMDALSTERIEALCDAFCKSQECKTTPRFSAGYGDLPLAVQPDLFALLQCEKKIGLCLTDGLMMSPSKSVTAIFGIKE